jgi:non-ribosomal peptide synthetase-like protein
MRIGPGCEISTIIDVVPETVRIGEASFFADGIYFCAPRPHRGTLTVAATELGRNTFLGNHAVVPAGHRYPDDFFVGVATVADAAIARDGTAWFGHPPMSLPRREVVAIDRRLTHEPDALRYGTRLFWELARFGLPVLPLLVAIGWLAAVAGVAALPGFPLRWGPLVIPHWVGLAAWLPLATLAALAAECGATIGLKWLLLGRVRPGQHPFWSCWCGRWDFLYVAWGFWARGALAWLEGTLFLNAVLRLVGMHIGRRVVLGAGFAQVVDPDMLHFEDDATVTCQFQAHSFEDRVLKIDHLRIGRGATVGHQTVVFYGVDIGAEAWVGPAGVVMKHDRLAAGRSYAGCPVRQVPGV